VRKRWVNHGNEDYQAHEMGERRVDNKGLSLSSIALTIFFQLYSQRSRTLALCCRPLARAEIQPSRKMSFLNLKPET